jgi:hypothetical protein
MLSRCLFALLLMAGNFLIGEPTLAQAGRYSFLCLPADTAWIAGVRLGDSLADVERKLGSPAHRAVGFGEDDGGTYEETQLSYSTLDVFLVRGVVDRVVTTDPKTCTAGGICPGLTLQQVRSRLELIFPELAATEPSSFVLCPEEGFLSDYYLTIEYTRAGEAAKLELALDRP